jgi:hypothetical protein
MGEYAAYKDGEPGSRRAPCLGCGRRVVTARNAHVLVGGKRDGSLLTMIDAEPQLALATDVDRHFTESGLELLGVVHRECAQRARERLEAQEVELPAELPLLRVEEDTGPAPPPLHVPPSLDRCPFCGNDATTAEHVLPRWVARELRKHGELVMRTEHGTRPVRSVDLTVPTCERCNHRWLSVLENDVRPILAALVGGEEKHLSLDDQTLLATWAVKTAFLLDLASSAPAVPAGFHYDLRQRRSALPSNVVWMGAYLGSRSALWARGSSLHFGIPKDEAPNAFVMTFGIFRVIFQVLGHFTVGNAEFIERRPHAMGLARIWPPPGPSVAWPPNRLAFDDDLLDDLADSIRC